MEYETKALLTIKKVPSTKAERNRMAKWLLKLSNQMLVIDPAEYNKNPKFRLESKAK